MKKTFLVIGIAGLILAGCSGSSSKNEADETLIKEVEQIEAVTSEIDSTIDEIEKSTEEVDQLLEEL